MPSVSTSSSSSASLAASSSASGALPLSADVGPDADADDVACSAAASCCAAEACACEFRSSILASPKMLRGVVSDCPVYVPPPPGWMVGLDAGHSHPDVVVGALVDIGVADDEEDVLGPAESDSGDALDVLEAELGNGLAGLLLVARVDGDGGARGDGC